MDPAFKNEIVPVKAQCAGIKCKCSVPNVLSKDAVYCSSVCRNSAIDQTIDQVNDLCDCNHPTCKQKQPALKGNLRKAEYLTDR